jgi:hypothetical protein
LVTMQFAARNEARRIARIIARLPTLLRK